MVKKERRIIATYPVCNCGGIAILDIVYGIEDKVTSALSYGEKLESVRTTKIFYDKDERPYFTRFKTRVYLDECVRI